MCELGRVREEFPKYPRVPVMACDGFVHRSEAEREANGIATDHTS